MTSRVTSSRCPSRASAQVPLEDIFWPTERRGYGG